jgi:hypothetical protein
MAIAGAIVRDTGVLLIDYFVFISTPLDVFSVQFQYLFHLYLENKWKSPVHVNLIIRSFRLSMKVTHSIVHGICIVDSHSLFTWSAVVTSFLAFAPRSVISSSTTQP